MAHRDVSRVILDSLRGKHYWPCRILPRDSYREGLSTLIRLVVAEGAELGAAIGALGIPAEDLPALRDFLQQELLQLGAFNYARNRLGISLIERWI